MKISDEEIKLLVKEKYAKTVHDGNGCCVSKSAKEAVDLTSQLAYTDIDWTNCISEANLGLGCGNPCRKRKNYER